MEPDLRGARRSSDSQPFIESWICRQRTGSAYPGCSGMVWLSTARSSGWSRALRMDVRGTVEEIGIVETLYDSDDESHPIAGQPSFRRRCHHGVSGSVGPCAPVFHVKRSGPNATTGSPARAEVSPQSSSGFEPIARIGGHSPSCRGRPAKIGAAAAAAAAAVSARHGPPRGRSISGCERSRARADPLNADHAHLHPSPSGCLAQGVHQSDRRSDFM